MLFYFLFTLILIFPLVSSSYSESKLKTLSLSTSWQRLNHYRKLNDGSYKSLIKGLKDPYTELKKFYKSFKEHPQNKCIHPAKYNFFVKHKLLHVNLQINCPDLKKWKNSFKAHSLSLIFAGQYPSNPASLFGHTFLRFNQKGGNSNHLMDWSLSFMALIEEKPNPLSYIIKGLFGFYPSVFSLDRYYKKILEYSNFENRSVWEYQLNLSTEQIEDIVNHLYELRTNNYFDYYFLSKNCSYFILSLLEIGNSNWNLIEDRYSLYTLPTSTIKSLVKNNAFGNIIYRPSVRERALRKHNNLSPKQKNIFKEILLRNNIPSIYKKDPNLLEALMAHLKYLKHSNENKLNTKKNKLWEVVLNDRSKLQTVLDTKSKKQKESHKSPHLSHQPFQLRLGMGMEENKKFMQMNFRPALHDLLNSDVGYSPYSQFTFLSLKTRYYLENKKIMIKEFSLLDMASFPPVSDIERPFSWKINFLFENSPFLSNRKFHLESGIGYTINLYNNKILLFLLPVLQANYFLNLSKISINPGLLSGLFISATSHYKVILSLKPIYHIDTTTYNWSFKQSYIIGPNIDVRLIFSGTNKYFKQLLQLSYHF